MLVLFFNGIAGIAGFMDASQLTIIAALAIIAQAVSTMVINKEALKKNPNSGD